MSDCISKSLIGNPCRCCDALRPSKATRDWRARALAAEEKHAHLLIDFNNGISKIADLKAELRELRNAPSPVPTMRLRAQALREKADLFAMNGGSHEAIAGLRSQALGWDDAIEVVEQRRTEGARPTREQALTWAEKDKTDASVLAWGIADPSDVVETVQRCAHYDEDEWGAPIAGSECDGSRTHYSCCYGFDGLKMVCEKHKCRCKHLPAAPNACAGCGTTKGPFGVDGWCCDVPACVNRRERR